jgi:hypothetical protein
MSRIAWGAGAASVALILGAICKHDRDEAGRDERVLKRLTALELATLASGASVSTSPPAMRGACALDSAELDAVARVVREAMSASAPREPASPAAEAPKAVPRTPEQEEALARAQTILDTMLKRRRITRDDAIDLRRELNASGSAEDVQQIERRIRIAINRDELVPDDPHFIP